MKVLLMHRDRDFVPPNELPQHVRYRDRDAGPRHDLADHEQAFWQDLELDTLVSAMAGEDTYLFDVARKALFLGLQNDAETILYRQQSWKDCLKNAAVVRELYALAVEAIEGRRKHYIGVFSNYPGGILRASVELLQMLMGMLRRLKAIADAHAGEFESDGFTALFAMLQKEFSDEYFARIENHLTELKFRGGVLLSARLGPSNEGTDYVLREDPDKRPSWLKRLFHKGPPAYTFYLHPRDEAGARILSEMQDRGVNLVANALAQSGDHVVSFFLMLRVELAFYVDCLNLHDRLAAMNAPTCFPKPEAAGSRRQRFGDLYDVCLALHMGKRIVGNDVDADGRSLVIITGANQGGKSSFLRSIGLAQLMMQCGMLVAAESFAAELCGDLFTHYKREEDETMKSGKLDEELARMSKIAETIRPNSLMLFNESFASTNEREGSEIARQIVSGLLERRIKVFFVTHLYDFAHGFFERTKDALFLRAERQPDGTRTFKLVHGEPLETSYGEDLYREVFGETTEEAGAG